MEDSVKIDKTCFNNISSPKAKITSKAKGLKSTTRRLFTFFKGLFEKNAKKINSFSKDKRSCNISSVEQETSYHSDVYKQNNFVFFDETVNIEDKYYDENLKHNAKEEIIEITEKDCLSYNSDLQEKDNFIGTEDSLNKEVKYYYENFTSNDPRVHIIFSEVKQSSSDSEVYEYFSGLNDTKNRNTKYKDRLGEHSVMVMQGDLNSTYNLIPNTKRRKCASTIKRGKLSSKVNRVKNRRTSARGPIALKSKESSNMFEGEKLTSYNSYSHQEDKFKSMIEAIRIDDQPNETFTPKAESAIVLTEKDQPSSNQISDVYTKIKKIDDGQNKIRKRKSKKDYNLETVGKTVKKREIKKSTPNVKRVKSSQRHRQVSYVSSGKTQSSYDQEVSGKRLRNKRKKKESSKGQSPSHSKSAETLKWLSMGAKQAHKEPKSFEHTQELKILPEVSHKTDKHNQKSFEHHPELKIHPDFPHKTDKHNQKVFEHHPELKIHPEVPHKTDKHNQIFFEHHPELKIHPEVSPKTQIFYEHHPEIKVHPVGGTVTPPRSHLKKTGGSKTKVQIKSPDVTHKVHTPSRSRFHGSTRNELFSNVKKEPSFPRLDKQTLYRKHGDRFYPVGVNQPFNNKMSAPEICQCEKDNRYSSVPPCRPYRNRPTIGINRTRKQYAWPPMFCGTSEDVEKALAENRPLANLSRIEAMYINQPYRLTKDCLVPCTVDRCDSICQNYMLNRETCEKTLKRERLGFLEKKSLIVKMNSDRKNNDCGSHSKTYHVAII